jgi:NAD(P)-dependent dehydrogenase (short-subunit alcohol dehydrogenase family)
MAFAKKDLSNKVAIVTGGNRGIGAAISRELAQHGAKVALTYNSSADSADALVEKIRETGGQAIAVKTQVSDQKEVGRMVETVANEFGGVDILVNNAGIMGEPSFLKISQEDWDRVMAVNLRGVFNCCQAVIPLMLQREDGGKIVNISSVAGKMGGLSGAQYAASKAGVIGLTMALSTEFAKEKLWVNAITPGPIATEMYQNLPAEVQQKFADSTHVGRVGHPSEIAHSVMFLLQNDFVAGETLNMSAGRYLD